MLTIKHTGIAGLGQIKYAMRLWRGQLASAAAALRIEAFDRDLDPRIKYDIGLSDLRPMVPKSGSAPRDPASVVAMHIGRY